MKKFLVVLMIVALVMVFASTAFAGVPGHPVSGPEFGDLTRGIATSGPEAIFGAIRFHFGF